ncbi:acyltransferase [uncultured Bilophila sp.]|uniref:acyltransferase n=1 Tax=uncultured Bilophila sp. TaxID=529385 RepID=UPI0026DB8445|nr:acyltransferase [uncultured Bilophila sp.]
MSTREFIHKRVTKTVIPFVFWSIIAFIYRASTCSRQGIDFDSSIVSVIINILNTKYMGVYWFFIPLFAIYLSIPFVSLIKNKINIFKYMIVYTLLSYSVAPLIANLFNISINNALQSPVSSGYMLYILLGYYIENSSFSKKLRMIIYFLAVLGWLMHFLGTLFLTQPVGPINTIFKGYLNLPCVMYSVGIFVFIKYIDFSKVKNNFFYKLINILSSLTFGIYLIHMFFVENLPSILGLNIGSIYWRIFGAIGIFILCSGIVFLMKKIPIIGKMFP